MSKEQLRRDCRKIRDSLLEDNRAIQEDYVNTALYKELKSLNIRQAKIGIYLPVKSELDINPVIKKLYEEGISLYAPVCLKDKNMVFKRYDPASLKEGAYHILEPDNNDIALELDVIIVPTLAVNLEHYRLGYGQGYYDRYLALHPTYTLCGVFREQVINDSFQECCDIKVNKIIFK